VACLRGWTATMFTSGLLAVGAGSVFCALAWLFTDYRDPTATAQEHRLIWSFSMLCAHGAVALVVLMMAITVQGYLLDVKNARPLPGWLGWGVWAYLLIVLVVLIGQGTVHALRRRGGPSRRESSVAAAAVAVLAFTIVSLVVLGLVTNRPAVQWSTVPAWIAWVAICMPLVATTGVLLTLVAALPPAPSTAALSDPKSVPSARPKPTADTISSGATEER
jgi:hypothetical protein